MRWSISSPVVRLIGVDLRNACWVNQAGYQHGSAARKRGSQVLKFRLHISERKQERTRCYIGLIMDWLLAFSKSGHAFALLLGAWALGAFACTFNEPSQAAPTPGLERTISAATVVAVPTNTLPATPSPDLLLPSLKTKQMLGQPIPSQLGHRKHSLQILLLYPMSTTWMPTLPTPLRPGASTLVCCNSTERQSAGAPMATLTRARPTRRLAYHSPPSPRATNTPVVSTIGIWRNAGAMTAVANPSHRAGG